MTVGVSCLFSDFHMSELVLNVKVQYVGVLCIRYCLSHDIITKGRQTGRQVWQATVWTDLSDAVREPKHAVKSANFLFKGII